MYMYMSLMDKNTTMTKMFKKGIHRTVQYKFGVKNKLLSSFEVACPVLNSLPSKVCHHT